MKLKDLLPLTEELDYRNIYIKNPKTGNKIKVSTALIYGPEHPAFELALRKAEREELKIQMKKFKARKMRDKFQTTGDVVKNIKDVITISDEDRIKQAEKDQERYREQIKLVKQKVRDKYEAMRGE